MIRLDRGKLQVKAKEDVHEVGEGLYVYHWLCQVEKEKELTGIAGNLRR